MDLDRSTDYYNDRGGERRIPAPEAKTPTVSFLALHPNAKIPKKGTLLSAGFDLQCLDYVAIRRNETVKIPLGFATSMPENIHGRIESRSGLALKGAVVLTGVIDADYRGEWSVILRYFGPDDYIDFKAGDRVAQVVFRLTPRINFEAVESLSETSRGAGGFGHTGA